MITSLRGSMRFSGMPRTEPSVQTRVLESEVVAGEAEQAPVDDKEPWISQSRKLIPGEALAGYVSLQAVTELATDPANVAIVLALAFLALTLFLRYVGTQDAEAADPASTVQWPVVVVSGIAFVALVYATDGQIFWHEPLPDQAIYGQILAVVLGIGGPVAIGGLTKS